MTRNAAAQAPANDQCSEAVALSAGVSASMSTAMATSTNDPAACANLGKGVWFSYTPCASGTVTVKTCGSNFNTVLSVYTGSCAALNPVAGGCADDSLLCGSQAIVSFAGVANTTYRILAGGNNGASGTLVIEANSPPCNDQCAGAIALANGVTFTMNTTDATEINDPVSPSCADGTKGVWFQFTPASSGTLVASSCGSDFDTVVEVFQGTCGALIAAACNDDGNGCSFQAVVSLAAVGGTTYRIFAAGFSDSFGTLRMRASLLTPLTISSPCPMPAGTLGHSYQQPLQATGGVPPYLWSIVSGSLPNGLTLNAATGSISGTPGVGGTFNFTARCVDSAGANVAKPCSIFIWQPPPDLQVTSLVVSPTNGWVNTTGSVCVTVRNNGQSVANNFTLSVWFNRWDSPVCGNTGSINQFIASLAAGATFSACYTFSFGSSAGTRKAIAFADSQCAVAESNESNNQKSASYSVSGLPDLTITTLTISPVSGLAGTTGSICIGIRNSGSGIANNFSLSCWVNRWTAAACGEPGSFNDSIETLGAGASFTVCYSFTFSGSAGTRKAIAFVDSQCSVTESSESNNQKSASYSVFDLPDLAIAALSLSPASGPVGTAATLTVTIKNGGKADAANFRLDVWHSLWATAPCGQTGNVGATIPLLGKGATMTFSYPVVFGEPAGNRKAIAFVDSQCAVTETSETNNQKSFLYTVTPLTVTDLENSGTPTGP